MNTAGIVNFSIKMTLLIVVVIISHLSVSAQLIYTKDKLQIKASDSSYCLRFEARLQPLCRVKLSSEEVSGEVLLRRVRLKSNGSFKLINLSYDLQIGIAPSDFERIDVPNYKDPLLVLYDAQIHFKPNDSWKFSIGQGKLPAGRERLMSSQDMQFVDRSLVDESFTLNRGVGAQVRYQVEIGAALVKQLGSIAIGEGGNIWHQNEASGLQYTFRSEILPFGDFDQYITSDMSRKTAPRLAFGLVFDWNEGALRSKGVEGDFIVVDEQLVVSSLRTFVVDAIYKQSGWSATLEYARRDTPNEPQEDFQYGQAFKYTLGYLFQSNFEVATRFATRSPLQLSEVAETNDFTLGASKYLKGHQIKIQTDVTRRFQDSGNSWIGRLQLELAI